MKMAPVITLSDEERKTLEAWSRGRSTQARRVSRAKVVLMAADGMTNESIAAELGTSKPTVGRWRSRFASRRIAGIEKDATRPGRLRERLLLGLDSQVVARSMNYRNRFKNYWITGQSWRSGRHYET